MKKSQFVRVISRGSGHSSYEIRAKELSLEQCVFTIVVFLLGILCVIFDLIIGVDKIGWEPIADVYITQSVDIALGIVLLVAVIYFFVFPFVKYLRLSTAFGR